MVALLIIIYWVIGATLAVEYTKDMFALKRDYLPNVWIYGLAFVSFGLLWPIALIARKAILHRAEEARLEVAELLYDELGGCSCQAPPYRPPCSFCTEYDWEEDPLDLVRN